jgi:ABC-type antimicrobial peptide transport system permease subunit
MFKSYLKITFRNLLKNKLFVFINILGLGIAIACCIVAFLNWNYNAKFDTYHADTDHVYRINFTRITNGHPIKNGDCPFPVGAQISTSSSKVDKVIRYLPIGGNFRIGDEVFRTNVAGVDPTFFEVFNFPLVSGSAEGQLKDKRSVLISTELQQKYFPNQNNPVGESLTYINGFKKIELQVSGVFEKPPKNTSFFSEAYISYINALDISGEDEYNWAEFNSTFITIDDPSQVAEVESQLQDYVAVQNQAKPDYKVAEYYLDPFVGMAVRAESEDIWNHWFNQSLPSAAATAPGIMAFLILLIACFNFTNTSIAIANRRIKEIGVRKVLGSDQKQLIFQFLSENVLLVSLALITGLLISVFLVPAYSAMWPFLEIKLNLLENVDLLAFLGLLLLFTALVAGSYPAFYVSSFQPITILRGKVKFSGTNNLTRVLLTMQFAISLLAIISGFVFSQNAQYQENYDMGFNMESIIYANVKDEQGFVKMRNELMAFDKIKEIAGSGHSISSSWYTDPIKYESTEMDVCIFDIGSGYLSTIGATLLEGRDFMENSQQDKESSVIINQELARVLGWDKPVGKRIVLKDTIALNVVGLVKDIYFEGGLWDPLVPMLMRYVPQESFRFLSVRTDTENLSEVKALMDKKWQRVFPDELSTVSFMDEEKAGMRLVNTNIKVMFIFLGIVAVLLSVIGLFSLVSLNLIKRMKEIGVRKILGASVENISFKVSKEFIVILFIASILGSIGGYFLSDLLMSSIWAYHVPLQYLPFVISIIILFVASGLTIGGKVFRAASMNPAEILKDE